MISNQLYRAFLDRPEFALALSLSAPSRSRSIAPRSFSVDLDADDVVLRIPRPRLNEVGPKIIATKQAIAASILLHHLLEIRGARIEDEIFEVLVYAAQQCAKNDVVNAERLFDFGFRSFNSPPLMDIIRERLSIQSEEMSAAIEKTQSALIFLEEEGLAVDPAFTPEMMILFGFVPMHFSVRTPKGDRINKELKLNAPLWSLDVKWGNQAGKSFTDIDFKFRGIQLVRSALTAMATTYLNEERKQRVSRDLPTVPRKGAPQLEDDSGG